MTSQTTDLITKASVEHQSGKLDACILSCQKILESEPQNLQANLLLGISLAKKDQNVAAIAVLESVATNDDKSFQARLWLSISYRKLGRSEEAMKAILEAKPLNPNDPQSLNQLGLCYLDIYEFDKAETIFRQALSLSPNVSIIHYGLGLALRGKKSNRAAIQSFRQAAQLAPNSVQIQSTIRQILMDEYDPSGAAECARAVIRLQPNLAEAHLWLARALIEDNLSQEAEQPLSEALRLDPDSALALTLLGSIHQIKGDLADAEACFKQSIQGAKNQGSAYYGLATNRKMLESDLPLLTQIEELIEAGELSNRHLSQLHYARGKILEDHQSYEPAMASFEEANRLSRDYKFGDKPFDRNSIARSYEFARETFTPEFLKFNSGFGSPSDLPILVLGMMRSGTTLTEQILSSHPDVGAGGEQRFWSDHRNDAFRPGQRVIDPDRLKLLEKQYLQTLQKVSPSSKRVVDKMPVNYEVIGPIHIAFPHAKIIHVTRNPVDTCISIFTTANRNRLEWAHTKEDIVFVYEQYLKLMSHWKMVIPAESMMEVKYEELVSDRDLVTRKMIDFCGLDWDDGCLRPEDNDRSVVTPSVWQVRQPVYKSSVARWKKYEPWLGPFARLPHGEHE